MRGQPPSQLDPAADFPVQVSVIMPAYNAERALEQAVLTVRKQTLTDWELLLIDDGSTDGTVALARELARTDPRIILLQQGQNTGAAQARNRGIREARGRFIAFLDADDGWVPDKHARQLAFMQDRDAALSYSGFWRVRGTRRTRIAVPSVITHSQLLRGNVIGCLTVIYDSAQLGRVEMPDLALRQDYATWLQILRTLPQAHGLDEPLAENFQTRGSLSSNRIRAAFATWGVYRREGLGPMAASFCLASHIWGRIRRG